MWIATKLSIDRYDGHQIIRYDLRSPDQQTPDNIGSNFVCISPDETVWAFTQSGAIYRYDEQSDSFVFVYSIRKYYNSYNIILNQIFFEDANTLLLATAKGVLRLDVNKAKAFNCGIMNGLDVYHIIRQSDLYYISTKIGLYVVRFSGNKDGKLISHLLENQFVNRVWYDSKYQQFWIGTFSNGIFILPKREGSSLIHIQPTLDKPIRAIIPYNEKQLAVGVDGKGVMLLNRQTFQIEDAFVQVENKMNSICGNSVWDLLLDHQKILWVATYHEGVSYSDRSNLKFDRFIHEKSNINSVSSNYINAILEDRDGDLWFGTNHGLSLFKRKTGVWKHFFQELNSANGNVILALCEGPDGKVWAGGYAFGAAEIDKQSGFIKRFHAGNPDPIVGTEYIYSIYKDEYSGNLWMGGIYGKISCYNPKTHQSQLYMEESLRCFSSYDDSTVVLGLYRGLFLMDKNTGKKRATLIKATVNHILKDGDRAYWVGTMINGLYYYDLKAGIVRRYTKDNSGLSSNHIYAIEKDEDGYLWLSTEDGLNKFSPKTGKVINFDKQDGLTSNLFIPHSSMRCSTSEILFGTADGAILFYPSEIKKSINHEHYPLIFTGFQLFGNPMKPGEKGSPLRTTVNKTSEIMLSHDKNYFSLTFTLPNYQSSDKTEYSYFLKGYDLDWSKPSNVNSASYSKIQPGKYTFILRAYIDRQLQQERRIEIIVNQPWWNSVWAWMAYVLILLFAAYYTIRYYSERSKKKQTQEKMEFFINTAHDILTPLSLIEAPLKDISVMSTLTEEGGYLLSLALNNTQKLSHFVHQLIDFQRINLNADHLIVSRNNPGDFLINKVNAYRPIASQKFISLDIHVPEDEKECLFDKKKLSKIVDNLLTNAIKYTPFGGKIEIATFFYDNEWCFSVKDSGIGIPQKDQNLIFKHIFRAENEENAQNVGSGVGLKMVSTLVRIHHGKITFSSKKGEGTEFVITLPYHYDDKDIDKSAPPEPASEFIHPEEEINARILVVESEPEMAAYLHNAFSREYSVEYYTKGADAFSQIARFQPQLILVDFSLSDMDGLSFCKKIKDNPDTSFIPVVMITELSDHDTRKKVFSSGATDFIEKPFEFEVLKFKVSNLLSLQQVWQNKALTDFRKSNVVAINNDRDQKFMDSLIQLIEINLDNPDLNISMLCKELALSRTLLYNRITQLTGHSPNEFIRNIRLKNAANLLISGKYSIAEISSMVGIDNPKYFSRIFKEYYEVSPKNYMK